VQTPVNQKVRCVFFGISEDAGTVEERGADKSLKAGQNRQHHGENAMHANYRYSDIENTSLAIYANLFRFGIKSRIMIVRDFPPPGERLHANCTNPA
jgi:hypothetical protein